MKHRAAVVKLDFDFIARWLFGEEARLHLVRPSFELNGRQVFEIYLTHPDLPEIEVGQVAPYKTVIFIHDAEGRIVVREFV